jgi:hypothetical protein
MRVCPRVQAKIIKVALWLLHDTKLFGPTAHSFQHGIHFERDGFFGLRLQFSALTNLQASQNTFVNESIRHYLIVVASFGMVQQSFGSFDGIRIRRAQECVYGSGVAYLVLFLSLSLVCPDRSLFSALCVKPRSDKDLGESLRDSLLGDPRQVSCLVCEEMLKELLPMTS